VALGAMTAWLVDQPGGIGMSRSGVPTTSAFG